MPFTRRDFFKISSFSALAAIVAPNQILGQAPYAASGQYGGLLMSQYRISDFERHIGSYFQLMTESDTIQSTLIEVKDSRGRQKAKGRAENFSLVFLLSQENEAPQSTYTITHQTLGNFELFLVPGKNTENQQLLIAIINRL